MKKVIKRDYKSDEGLIVIHHTLDALYQKYCYCIPKKIEKLILDLVVETKEMLNSPNDGTDNINILEKDFVESIKYTKK